MASPAEFSLFPVALFGSAIVLAVLMTFLGHKRILTNVVVGSVLFGLFSVFFVLEVIFLILTPYRILFRQKTVVPADEANAQAAGKRDVSLRKIILFDGVCVLCNRAGQFVVSHLPDPNLVSFVPIQDALANPHVSLGKLKEEFPELKEEMLEERICVISGDRMLWGADSVMEVCSWMYAPFPIIKYGKFIPAPIRDMFYMVVSKNRYDWFGTQPLEQNFSKQLCPYLHVRNFMQVKTD